MKKKDLTITLLSNFLRIKNDYKWKSARQSTKCHVSPNLYPCLTKKGLRGGATNNHADKNEVLFTIEGEKRFIDELIDRLKTKEKLNSWGAQVEALQKLSKIIPIKEHQVTTENVNDFNWSPDVEMYI